MGIDSIRTVAGGAAASFQNAPLAKPVKAPETKTASEAKADYGEEAVSLQTSADAVVVSRTGSENKQGSENDAEQRQSRKQRGSLMETAKDVNKKINNNTIAEFGYHEATNRITIKIKDKDTDEVIKEFPPEKALELLEKAWEIAGILVDEKR